MPELERGLVIVAAGMGGVFFNLLVLMVSVTITGKIFGKKPRSKAKKPDAAKKPPKVAADAPADKSAPPDPSG